MEQLKVQLNKSILSCFAQFLLEKFVAQYHKLFTLFHVTCAICQNFNLWVAVFFLENSTRFPSTSRNATRIRKKHF